MRIAVHGLMCALTLSKPENEGWMSTAVDVEVPSFQGQFRCTIELQEWKQFIRVLQRLSDSVGKEVNESWGNMEANVEFGFTLRKLGAVEGTYKFSSDNFSLGPVLSGSFQADQTFLAAWLRDAQEVLENAR